jgi:hypothetical protein
MSPERNERCIGQSAALLTWLHFRHCLAGRNDDQVWLPAPFCLFNHELESLVRRFVFCGHDEIVSLAKENPLPCVPRRGSVSVDTWLNGKAAAGSCSLARHVEVAG